MLSEHERRMLAEIEQALFDSDPKFARSVKTAPRGRARRPVMAGVFSASGMIALVAGMIMATLMSSSALTIVGIGISVVGFIAMVIGVWLFVYGQPGHSGPTAVANSGRTSHSFSDRMEERFRRRQDDY